MSIKIMLDAGHHGNYNRSPVLESYYESHAMWKLHLFLKEELESYGFTVLTTRGEMEKDLPVLDRGIAAKGCDVFLSLHSNACDTESVDRVEIYYPSVGKEKDDRGLLLGKALAMAAANCMGVTTHAAKTKESKVYPNTEYYGVMRGACKAGVPLYFILEHSFHTNLRAAKWLSEESNLRKLAKEEALVFYRFFTICPKGDLNGDGKADGEDLALLKKAVLLRAELTKEQKETADMNDDGLANGLDYLILKALLED